MRKLIVLSSACLVAALMLTVPALAAEGRIPLWEPTVLPGPGITGKYVVTRNIAAPAGGTAISVLGTGQEEIDIDLDGKTLFGDPAGALNIIEVIDVRTVVIRNGSLRALGPPAGGNSVFISNVQKVILEDLRIEDGGIGISLKGSPSFAIRRNVIVGADPVGIQIEGAGLPVPLTGFVEDNLVKDSIDVGIWVFDNHSGVSIDRNRVDRTNGGPGIWVQFGSACKLAENIVQEAGTDGIQLEGIRGCKVYNNVTSFNNANGIAGLGTTSTLFLDNVSSDNSFSGLMTDGFLNRMEQNVLTSNGGCGLWFVGPDNTYGKNTARGNLGGAGCGPCAGGPLALCPVAGGSFAPDLCVDAPGNTSFCDNLMPGPPTE